MNFFNNQLIKNEMQARLFGAGAVDSKYKRYEDHEVAIRARLYDLVEDAINEKENPKALIEDFLNVPYTGGDTVDEIVNFLCNSHHMIQAFEILKENWNNLDESAPDDSLLYATSGVDDQKAFAIYLETTLRNYLESLSRIYHG